MRRIILGVSLALGAVASAQADTSIIIGSEKASGPMHGCRLPRKSAISAMVPSRTEPLPR
jgi:hypothetical protein